MNKKELGKKGESICCRYLIKNGFEIISRNYHKRIGEIDIIAFKKGTIHFFEVKTVSRETVNRNKSYNNDYHHNPEENVTREKINRIEKTAQLFLSEKGFKDEYIQIDLLTVYLTKNNYSMEELNYFINYIPNINFN